VPGQAPTPSSPRHVHQSTTLSSSLQQHHGSSLPLSPPLGDTNSHPKIEVYFVSKNTELAVSEVDFFSCSCPARWWESPYCLA
jgi:hypothetical protein